MIMVSFLVSIYYVVILAWILYFLFASFITPLPWTTCNNEWNTPHCLVRNGSNANESGVSPAVEYFKLVNKCFTANILSWSQIELYNIITNRNVLYTAQHSCFK